MWAKIQPRFLLTPEIQNKGKNKGDRKVSGERDSKAETATTATRLLQAFVTLIHAYPKQVNREGSATTATGMLLGSLCACFMLTFKLASCLVHARPIIAPRLLHAHPTLDSRMDCSTLGLLHAYFKLGLLNGCPTHPPSPRFPAERGREHDHGDKLLPRSLPPNGRGRRAPSQ